MSYCYGVLRRAIVTVQVNRRGEEYVDFDLLVSRSAVEREMRMGQAPLNGEECLKDENWAGKQGD